MTALARPQNKKAIIFGVIAVLFLAGAGVAGASWWKSEHDRPSQASRTDCVLAQKLVDSAQEIPSGEAAVEEWVKSEQQLRSQLDDGYLGANISVYSGWAALNAKGEGTPQKKELQELADKANSHCSNANVTLEFPPIAS